MREWRDALAGLTVSVSVQTCAELRGGWAYANWAGMRLEQARGQLGRTPTLPVDERVIDEAARLFAECKRAGHALHAKEHTGDRWVAATACAYDVPLLAVDGIYRDVPGLTLFEATQ